MLFGGDKKVYWQREADNKSFSLGDLSPVRNGYDPNGVDSISLRLKIIGRYRFDIFPTNSLSLGHTVRQQITSYPTVYIDV